MFLQAHRLPTLTILPAKTIAPTSWEKDADSRRRPAAKEMDAVGSASVNLGSSSKTHPDAPTNIE